MRTSVLGLALAALLISSSPAFAKKGVVFVHGKGGSDLASQSVANAYWGSDMIRATTKGYAVPYLVCHYDGTQYMWVAAGQVAGQITTWMNANAVDEIQVVTHSFGGVVLRWILSNPTYDSRYPEIIASSASTRSPLRTGAPRPRTSPGPSPAPGSPAGSSVSSGRTTTRRRTAPRARCPTTTSTT
ncbi:MAG TPA: hypothetical protein PKA62_09780 [Thermoanaerobaculia bacterium]|nr:hypothetical protein [Thermoanaerobaculia bacterium]